MHLQHTFCKFFCLCFARLPVQCRFALLKREASKLHIIFYGGIVVCADLDFLKVVRMVTWSGVVGPDTNFRSLARASRSALVRSRCALTVALRAQKLDLCPRLVVTKNFLACVPFRFLTFSLLLIFTLLAASISHFLTVAMKF